MANGIVPFEFEGFEVRVLGDTESPMFVAGDVCKVLGIVNVSQALDRIPDDWKDVCSTYTPGGEQDVLCISEPGLYELVFASRKESAKRFRRWVFEEVLPQIRKTGKYELTPEPASIALPPTDIRIVNLHTALSGLGIDAQNPRYQQYIQDVVLDQILGAKTLPVSVDRWAGVAEIAEEMGYASSLVAKNRAMLGKYVASCGLTKTQEKRLCNGTFRSINLYLDCQELRSAISEFMDAKVLSTVAE